MNTPDPNEDPDQVKNDADKNYHEREEYDPEYGCQHNPLLPNTTMSLGLCLRCGRDAYDLAGMDG
jgi:hypothetical protein